MLLLMISPAVQLWKPDGRGFDDHPTCEKITDVVRDRLGLTFDTGGVYLRCTYIIVDTSKKANATPSLVFYIQLLQDNVHESAFLHEDHKNDARKFLKLFLATSVKGRVAARVAYKGMSFFVGCDVAHDGRTFQCPSTAAAAAAAPCSCCCCSLQQQ